MIDPNTNNLIRVRVYDLAPNKNLILKFFYELSLHDDKYGVDFLQDCVMVDGKYLDAFGLTERFPKAIFYGVYAEKEESGKYTACQIICNNSRVITVSDPVSIGYDAIPEHNWNIDMNMHLYGNMVREWSDNGTKEEETD